MVELFSYTSTYSSGQYLTLVTFKLLKYKNITWFLGAVIVHEQ